MKFYILIALIFARFCCSAQISVGLIAEPIINISQSQNIPQWDSVNSVKKHDLTIGMGIEIKKKWDRYNSISLIPGFYQTNLRLVRKDLQFLDIIHPALPEIRDLTQTASKIANLRYRNQYIGLQVLINRQLQLQKIPQKIKVEAGYGLGVFALAQHSIKIQTEGFAVNNTFMQVINKETGVNPKLYLIQILGDINLLYNLTPKLILSGGIKAALPLNKTNTENFSYSIYTPGFKIGLRKII